MTRGNDSLPGIRLKKITWLRANAAKVLVIALLVFGLPALAASPPGCGGSVGPGGGVVTLNNDILACGATPALIVTGPVTLDMQPNISLSNRRVRGYVTAARRRGSPANP